MFYAAIILISSILLAIQCLGFYELIPLLSFSLWGNSNVFAYYIHSCVCKWGLIFAVFGIILGLLVLTDKNDKFKMRDHTKKYAIFFVIITLFSII